MNAIGSLLRGCLTPLLIAVLLSSCTTTQQHNGDSDVHQRTDLERRSLATAFERLGNHTIYDHVSRASDLGGEFYTPINARFPPDAPASRRILVREVRWQRGDRYIAAFSTRRGGAWLVFDAIEWHKDIVF